MVRRCRTRERERDGHHLRGARPRVPSGPGQRASALLTTHIACGCADRRCERVDRPHVTYLDLNLRGPPIGRRVDDVRTERDHARRPPERVAIDAVRHVRRIARSIPASEADTRPIAFGRSDRALHARKGTLRR